MNLEERMARLESKLDEHEEKRQALVAETLALRAAFVTLIPIISASLAAQSSAGLEMARERLTTELLVVGFSESMAEQAIEALEALFSAIDAVRGAMGQPPSMVL